MKAKLLKSIILKLLFLSVPCVWGYENESLQDNADKSPPQNADLAGVQEVTEKFRAEMLLQFDAFE